MSAITAPVRRPHVAVPTARTPHLRVVEGVHGGHRVAYLLLIVAILGSAVFGVVALNAMAAANAVEARALDAEVAAGERAYGQLVAEVAELEDPARIRARAEELGLVPAETPRYLAVDRRVAADGLERALDHGAARSDPVRSALAGRSG